MIRISRVVGSIRPSGCLTTIHRYKDGIVGNRSFSSSSLFQQSSRSDEAGGPLDGIRVLDLTRILAGPYCTMLLGDLGADVIKIEHAKRGDDTRIWGPPFAPYKPEFADTLGEDYPFRHIGGESAYFLCVNRNKRSVAVDIKSEAGKQVIIELAKKSDVLVENYVPGKLASMGLGYEQLRKVNDQLIYASITGKAGYDVMIEAEAGLMHITGEKGGNPVKVGVAITDLTTGLYAHGAIMAALLARQRTKRGQHLDLSLLESQVASLANIGSNYLIGGKEAVRWGTQHPSIVPYRTFETKNGAVCLGGGNDSQFKVLVTRLDLGHLADDPRFSQNKDRVKNRDDLSELLEQRISQMTVSEVLEKMEGSGLPYAPLNNMKGTFDHPQVRARGMVQTIDHVATGPIDLVGPAVKYSETKAKIRMPPPLLGHHTEQVLSDVLGYDKEQIEKVVKGGGVVLYDYNVSGIRSGKEK
ncbi:hypothetical protein H4219_004937 [Mycoemilia scoparia]|uniref:Uncharacterized protein n=1 Tax=Mycoemilia scoparia TaxID=417184 RepID=A0A9W8DM08_9FUNG|nr:hypothetical protein H4219_004937 [Mycoemilia scoparia]